jgi:hypothetical protein
MTCSANIFIKMGGESGAGNEASRKMTETMKGMMLYFMPIIMTAVVAFQPAALQVSFLTAMFWGVGQSYCFRQIWFRKLFKMELLPSQISRFDRPSHAALESAAAKIKANGVAAAKKENAYTSGHGKLRTVSAPPLRYEAPRTQSSKKFAVFQAPPKVEPQRAATPPAPKGGMFDGIMKQAAVMKKEASDGINGVMGNARKQTGAQTAREQRAEEYEKRRKSEKKDEAQMRRQGRG